MHRVLFFFFYIPLLAAQPGAEVEIASDPSYHQGDFSYGSYQVFSVEVAPHAATLLHRHRHDYISVTLGDAHILNEVQGKHPADLKLKDGDVRFTPGNFAHVLKNLSEQPFRNVTIELLQDGKTGTWRATRGVNGSEETFPGGHVKLLFVKDGVKVSEVSLDPGATVPNHRYDGLHLVVALSDLDLRGDLDGMDRMFLKSKSGDVGLLPGGYTNTGARVAKFVTLGF